MIIRGLYMVIVGYTGLYIVIAQCLKLLVGNFKLHSYEIQNQYIDLEKCMKLKCIGNTYAFHPCSNANQRLSSLSLSHSLFQAHLLKMLFAGGCIKGCGLSQMTAWGDKHITQ